MSSLALPRPANLRGNFGALVESDVYDIATRIKEVDPNLYIYDIEQTGSKHRFAICEMCGDGVERLVYRTAELDARVIEHVEYLRHVPFDRRFAEAEKLAEKYEAEAREDELNELYERMGRPMLTQLVHDGFTEGSRSFAKSGATGGRGSRRRAA